MVSETKIPAYKTPFVINGVLSILLSCNSAIRTQTKKKVLKVITSQNKVLLNCFGAGKKTL